MANRQPIYILFTLDCLPAAHRNAPEGPRGWGQSAAAIDGFCSVLFSAGYLPTVFLSPECASTHGPLLEEVRESGGELGLYVDPRTIGGHGSGRFLGQYGGEEQRAIVGCGVRQFQDALGLRPQSVRSAMYSASDHTFGVLYELGFRQGSLSSPGRRIAKHGASWQDAPSDPHYVHPADRRAVGDLPFLEIPVTTDATQMRDGVSPDLTIEYGTVAAWHRPLVEGQLERMAAGITFRTLCFVTRNCFAYHQRSDPLRGTLIDLLDYLTTLSEQFDLIPTTPATAHAHFRKTMNGSGSLIP